MSDIPDGAAAGPWTDGFHAAERMCQERERAALTAEEIRMILVNLDWETTQFPPAVACREKLHAAFKAADPEAWALYESITTRTGAVTRALARGRPAEDA